MQEFPEPLLKGIQVFIGMTFFYTLGGIIPTISLFFGILVRMYLGKSEHNPLHIHVFYQDYQAQVDISKIEFIEGEFPVKQK
ncbi:MAG: hypothetical protein HW421_3022 [Ignavibacteria bacterium]|nr:hypothetical protein [Ignavibacteria bacterium]